MLKPCVQTKIFSFSFNTENEKMEKEINDWKKDTILNGDSVCPSPPSVCAEDGYLTFVYTYSIPLEVPDKPVKKK